MEKQIVFTNYFKFDSEQQRQDAAAAVIAGQNALKLIRTYCARKLESVDKNLTGDRVYTVAGWEGQLAHELGQRKCWLEILETLDRFLLDK